MDNTEFQPKLAYLMARRYCSKLRIRDEIKEEMIQEAVINCFLNWEKRNTDYSTMTFYHNYSIWGALSFMERRSTLKDKKYLMLIDDLGGKKEGSYEYDMTEDFVSLRNIKLTEWEHEILLYIINNDEDLSELARIKNVSRQAVSVHFNSLLKKLTRRREYEESKIL